MNLNPKAEGDKKARSGAHETALQLQQARVALLRARDSRCDGGRRSKSRLHDCPRWLDEGFFQPGQGSSMGFFLSISASILHSLLLQVLL